MSRLSFSWPNTLWKEILVTLIISLLAIGWLFGSVLDNFTTVIASGELVRDGLQNVWMLWWTAHAITHGKSPFQTEMLYYPMTVDLFWQPLQVTNGVLALPITLSLGPIASYNVIAIFTFISSALLMYILARSLGSSAFAAHVVAMIYAFSPFHITKLYDGQLEVMSIQYFPLLTMGLFYVIYEKKWQEIVCIVISFINAWIMLTSLYYGLFALLYTAAFFGWSLLINRTSLRQYLIQIVRMALCLIVPVSLALVNIESLPHSSPEVASLRIQGRSAQIIDFLLPSPHHPIWGEAVTHIQTALHPFVQMTNISLGIVLWVLVALSLGHLHQHPMRRFNVILALTFMVLAMGPQLIWNGQPTGIPLPYRLIADLPGVQASQRPNHFIILAAIHLCLLAAGGIDDLLDHYPRHRSMLAWGLIGLIIFDLIPQPVPGLMINLSPAYQLIPPGNGAVLELPFQMENPEPMVAQLQHQRPILGGYLARTPDYDFVRAEGIASLWFGAEWQTILSRDWRQQLIGAMQAQDIEYIVVHEQLLNSSQRYMTEQLAQFLEVVYRDEQTSLYRRPLPPQPNLTFSLGKGWYNLERTDDGIRWQWTADQADVHVFNSSATSQQALLQMVMVAEQPTTLIVQGATTAWHVVPVTVQPRCYTVIVTVPPGHSILTLTANPVWLISAESRIVGVMVRSLQLIRYHADG